MRLFSLHSIIDRLGFPLLVLLNAFLLHSPVLGMALLILWAWRLRHLLGEQEPAFLKSFLGLWIALSSIMVIGTLVYTVSAFSQMLFLLLVLLLDGLASTKAAQKKQEEHILQSGPLSPFVFLGTHIFPFLVFLFLEKKLFLAATQTPLRSPWETVPPIVFALFLLLAFTTLYRLLREKINLNLLALVSCLLWSILTVTALVFPLGYGFDTFIHQATETQLAQTGSITPKPFYYIGHYALVLTAHHVFSLPIEKTDTFLVPILFVLLIPCFVLLASRRLFPKTPESPAALLAIFLLPLSTFTISTPQSLANLWLLLLVLLSLSWLSSSGADERPRVGILLVGTLAILATHPIAGLPSLFFLALFFLRHQLTKIRFQKLMLVFLGIVGALLVPLSFLFQGYLGGQTTSFTLEAPRLLDTFRDLALWDLFSYQHAPFHDISYAIASLRGLACVLLVLLGIRATRGKLAYTPLYLTASAACLGSYLLLQTLFSFPFLIDYERANYATRFLPLIILFLIPFLIVISERIHTRLRALPALLQLCALLGGAIILTGLWYQASPRVDRYQQFRGYTVGAGDLEVVSTIETHAAGAPYVVLANQTVSAAAIKTFGFVRYQGEQFFYPIPTGGELYQFFLDMNERPSVETIEKVRELMEVQRVYFVVNDYWWDALRISETAKLSATHFWREKNAWVFVWE